MSSTNKEENADPDYENIQEESVGEVNESLQREDARDQTIHKMHNIIHEQFSFEIDLKEKEVLKLNHRVHECRASLDRLRACILAGYYGYGNTPASVRQIGVRSATNKPGHREASLSDIVSWKRSLPSNLKEQLPENLSICKQVNENPERSKDSSSSPRKVNKFDSKVSLEVSPSSESRFYVKRRIIIGNTSKYILPEQRERNDRSTHKWMVYVRGPKEDEELQNFISKVWFLLHPSYQPNDLVEICKPPFQVTRRGWGEFPVRVQLHFVDNKNKRVDIIHHLKLDKTYTGLQTLGAETHVEIELDRKNFDGLNLPQCQDTNKKNMATSLDVVLPKSSSEQESIRPVSSKNFDLTLGHDGMSMDCDGSKVEEKASHQDECGLKSDYGILSDHSYSTVATGKLPHKDDMKYPTPPTSKPGSRSSSPKRDAKFQESFSGDSDFDHEILLQECVKQFPVVNPEKTSRKPGYCANSLEQFFDWNLGKRLAAEWQRAAAMKTFLRSQIGKDSQSPADFQKESPRSSLSTKEVMNYCRMHGFTPMVEIMREGNTLCKYCGEQVTESDVNENDQPMLVHEECASEFEEDEASETAEEFLETLRKSKCISEKLDQSVEEDGIIDVVTHKDLTKDSSKTRLFFLPTTAEHEWIQEIAKDVNVLLTNSDIDGVHAPVTSAMLYKACTMFVEEIVRKANRFTWKNPLRIPKAKCILPYHVKQAVEVIPHCDFLTNKYLKVEFETPED